MLKTRDRRFDNVVVTGGAISHTDNFHSFVMPYGATFMVVKLTIFCFQYYHALIFYTTQSLLPDVFLPDPFSIKWINFNPGMDK